MEEIEPERGEETRKRERTKEETWKRRNVEK